MIGGLKQTTSRLAIAAAAGLFTGGIALTPAQAADLGGDCCADLEERVAELEATTVRKGNRKVSVTLYGQVNRAILYWDDGEEDDVYFVDNENSSSRFGIRGSATISPGRTAGFHIEADWAIRDNSNTVSNCDGEPFNSDEYCDKVAHNQGNSASDLIDMRRQELWIQDERLGRLTLGHGPTASDGTEEVDLSGTGIVMNSNPQDIGGAFFFREDNGDFSDIQVGDAARNLDGASRRTQLRYDSPAFAGFIISTGVGADDFVDGAIRYSKEWNSVRCAAAAGVVHLTESRDSEDLWRYSSSASCIHTPSGLNLTGVYSEDDESDDIDTTKWMLKAGISRRWNSHGKTSLAAQYVSWEDSVFEGDDTTMWGIALVQNIDAAAMDLFVSYQTYDYDDGFGGESDNHQDMDFFIAGSRIRF